MNRVARSSLIIAFFFAIDKGLGLLRQALVARQFALSGDADVFNAANNIPDLLSVLISGGALGVALIPVLSQTLQQQGRPAAWGLFTRILNLAFLATAAVAVVVAVFARPLIENVIAPGFTPAQAALAAELMRLDLIAILIFSISGLVMAGLQTNQHFLLPAMAPAMYNLGQIFGVAVLAQGAGLRLGPLSLPPGLGLGIRGLVYGVIAGAVLHLLIQVPGLLRYGFRWQPIAGLADAGVRRVLRLMGPRVITMFFLQLFFIIQDNLASRLGEGAVTALSYGWFIMQVPETLIGTAIAIALLPTLAEHLARGETDGFIASANQALRALAALTLPVAAVLIATLPPLVQLVFGFDAEGTARVAWTARAFLLGLAGHALLEVAARAFYAQQDAITPLGFAALNAAVYTVLALALAPGLAVAGLALANSLAFTLEAILLLWLLNRRYPGVLRFEGTLPRALAAALLAGGLGFAIANFLPGAPVLAAAAGLSVGGLAALLLIWTEIRMLLRLV
jgi:putative peptidoglycan lipid II flippase